MIDTSKTKTKKSKKVTYIYAIGRRKTATARIRLHLKQTGGITVNDKPIAEYFPGKFCQKFYLEPLRSTNLLDKYLITAKVEGSGRNSQMAAVIHGIARAIAKLDPEKNRPILKKHGFLTRDPRKRQRRMVGMGGKARRKKQSPRR